MNLFTTWNVGRTLYIRFAFFGVLFFIASAFSSSESLAHRAKIRTDPPPPQGTPFTVVVYDGTNNLPLELARVALYRGSSLVIGKVTNPEGRAIFSDITPGWYRLVVRSVGYNPVIDSIPIDASHTFDSVTLFEESKEVTVSGFREPAITTIDPTTGNQVFEAETYHAPPTARMTQLVQENLLGAVRAPTGEVHVHGQHGEFTYYVDGAPIPLGVFGGLNEVVDPKVIERATFITDGFPAEYGGQMAAVIELQNRVPTGAFHLDFSGYGGSYLPSVDKSTILQPDRFLNMNGQSLAISDHVGKLGFFLSGTRQETDRRIDPPVQTIFHDHGFDYFLYGKADYLLSDKDYLTLNLNYGITNTQVPFDSIEVGGIGAPQAQDDQQYTTNSFQTLSYFRSISTETDRESNLLVAGFAREGSLKYTPGALDVPTVEDSAGDTAHVFGEDRNFTTIGIRAKYDNRLSHEFMYAAGFDLSTTSGTEDFAPLDSARFNPAAPHSITNYSGQDIGAFVETEIHPAEWTRIDLGVRYDIHKAPDTTENQLSPRARWNFLIDENNGAYLYYGRLFMPNNLEGLRNFASAAGGASFPGTLAERDNLYEAVYTHSFNFGLRSKLDYFMRDSKPGVDDATIASTSLKTPINIEEVHIQGLELGLSYSSPLTPFSGFVNASLIHAYGVGTLTGGFLPPDVTGDSSATDLDHDQRLSVVASLNYQPTDWYFNVMGIYGSGLANGQGTPGDYKTGLFDFNQYAHVTPSWIFNLSVGYTFHLTGGATIAPSLYVGNVLDNEHLLKGAYFSAASWEETRNVILRVDVHL
ncbi:MAG TPA: hypothetical protein VG537_11120 [Candidatus Kapabacteria bacterium]|jgi:hypothetical protein|nr:hypothetical protein [Candidatus Kapabacteria bacterium]